MKTQWLRFWWRLVKFWGLASACIYHWRYRRAHRKPLYLDIGARGGPARKWNLLRRLGAVEIAMVEPEPRAAAALARDFPGIDLVPHALGADDNRQATLYVCAEPAVSSLFEPDPELLRDYSFAPAFQVVSTASVMLRRFDRLVETEGRRVPEFLKIDVQGYELEVLRGFGERLADVLAVELEAQFFRYYKGQPLFGDIYAFMIANGFGLLDVRPQSNFDEFNIAEANFFFARDRQRLDPERRGMVEMWRRLMRISTSLELTLATG